MRLRNTLILLLVFGVLGGYVYYTDVYSGDAKRKAEDAKRKVFQFEGKEIAEILLVQDGAKVTGSRKSDKDWEISSPAGLEADSGEWDTLAGHIAGLEKEKSVDENPKDLAVFGLKEPAVQIFIKRKDGSAVEIGIGDEDPSKALHYVKISTSAEVFLTANSITSFKKSLTDLRNKSAIEILPENIDTFTIAEGTKKTTIKKSGDEWRIDGPGVTGAKADTGEVTAFLGSVQFARATDFADTSAAGFDIKKAGIDPPALQLILHDSKAGADHTLVVGNESGADKFYAKDASRPAIFILDKPLVEKLRQPVFAWRDKAVAKIERDKIDEIEVVRGSDKLALKRTVNEWKLADGRKVQPDRVQGFLDAFDAERIQDIVDGKPPAGSGLEKPKMQVVVRAAGKEVVSLTFGGDSKKPEGIYAIRAEGPTVIVVSKDFYDKLNVKAEDIVEVAESKPAPAPAQK